MNRPLLYLCVALAAASPQALMAAPAHHPARATADARLKALYDGYADWDATETGQFWDRHGELQPADRLAHVDQASQRRREAHLTDVLRQLDAIPAKPLSPSEQVNAAIFRTVLENALIEARARTWEMPFNSDSSFWTYLNIGFARQRRGLSALHRPDARHTALFRRADRQHARRPGARVQRAAGDARRPRRIHCRLRRRPRRAKPVLQGVRANALDDPGGRARAATRRGSGSDRAIGRARVPQAAWLHPRRILPKARTTIAARDLPDGDAFYRAQIREYTTTDMSPEEIHQLGLKEVARIDAEMLQDDGRGRLQRLARGLPEIP